VQHALRAFTAKDRRAINKAAENYPITEFYDTNELITSLGIGQALVTCLNEKGIPTPLAATLMRAPITRMDILTSSEIDELVGQSALVEKYAENIDRQSAYEILSGKIDKIRAAEDQVKRQEEQAKEQKEIEKQREKREKTAVKTRNKVVRRKVTRREDNLLEDIGTGLIKDLARGLLGVLGRR
jgi:hypothetical protein